MFAFIGRLYRERRLRKAAAIRERRLSHAASDVENASTAALKSLCESDRCHTDPELLLRVQNELTLREGFRAEAEVTISVRRDEETR